MTAFELNAPVELVLVDLVKRGQQQPAFLARNPAGRVPVLEDGGFVLTLADISLATPLMTIATAKAPVTQFKHLHSWFARIQARESWQRTASPAPGLAAA